MGRYPLMVAAEKYLEVRELKVGTSTMKYEKRKVRHIVREFEAMRERKEIRTTNPKEIGPIEIRAFLGWMRDPSKHNGKPLDPDTQVHYLSKIEGILEMNDNRVLKKMRDEGYSLPQKGGRKPIRAIAQPDLDRVQASARMVKNSTGEPSGWRKAKARLLMTAYVATGLRPSELRLSFVEDLDVNRWRLYVRTPKGSGVWAENRTVTIMPPYRQDILDFLRERDELLRYYGKDRSTYLIPNLRGGGDKPYSENHFRVLKAEVQRLSGVDFHLKDFRSTFATMSVEKDPNLLIDVSAQLGHSNLKTTQRFYAQISAESAGSRLEKAWDAKPISETNDKNTNSEIVFGMLIKALGINTPEDLQQLLISRSEESVNPRIDSKTRLTGYN
ncbi:MAG: tyrosine-type recombinase/integrase [Methanomassiliicoccales archaeon]